VKIALLAALFSLTALLYASVGFGGGSTYTALLIATGTDYRVVPLISLACNIIVVSSNSIRYSHASLIPWRRLWPLIVLSIPASWIGGRLVMSESVFIGLLSTALLIAGLRLLLSKGSDAHVSQRSVPIWQTSLVGAAVGLYSGLVGIGGGIFLAPILHLWRWGNPKTIAATCSLFILVNSLSGLAGQWTKLSNTQYLNEAINYWPLLLAVLIGGFIGNYFGIFKLSQAVVKRLTGALILIVAIRLAVRWASLIL